MLVLLMAIGFQIQPYQHMERFQTQRNQRLECSRTCGGLYCAAAAGAEVPFSSRRWPPLKSLLDELPAFTCVNAKGEPLGYQDEDGSQFSIFFNDIERAEKELSAMKDRFPELGLRLLSAGLGDAFERSVKGKALLVPSAAALERAGDKWDSEVTPLFTCLAMSKPASDGSGVQVLPFFMHPKDAQKSLDSAVSQAKDRLSEAQLERLQLVCTPLQRAVQIILQDEEATFCSKWGTSAERFELIPPSSSVDFLRAAMAELDRRGQGSAAATPAVASPGGVARGVTPGARAGMPPPGLFPD